MADSHSAVPPSPPARRADPGGQGGGCLAAAVRIPVRVVVLVIVVPVRIVWDLLAVAGRALGRVLLRPLGRAAGWAYEQLLVPVGRALMWTLRVTAKLILVWPWAGLWRHLLVPLWTHGVVLLSWTHRHLLAPCGRGIARLAGNALLPVLRYLLVIPSVWFLRQVLVPLQRGFTRLMERLFDVLWAGLSWSAVNLLWKPAAWVVRQVLAPPLRLLWRYVLKPLGRETLDALEVTWRIAGKLSHALAAALAWLLLRPARWFYRNICTPVGHIVRDQLWRPAKQAAIEAGRAGRSALRAARETVRRALRTAPWRPGGEPAGSPPVEPAARAERTLGSTTTVPGATAGPEISLRKRG
ncbi:hypothetical protein [Streptomyces sp. CAU 1734]|uniref:hypothetical protein n=1 Tax=Streptomyces sp. CAU 1734 TaxID=3140360 RepID=UPI0032616BAB